MNNTHDISKMALLQKTADLYTRIKHANHVTMLQEPEKGYD
jgi:hypothetical protein